MCCKALLVAVVVMVVVFHQGFGLSCFDCFSMESWEQCDKSGMMRNCSDPKILGTRNASCIKAVRYKLNKNKQEEWLFMKRCFETDKCNKKFCLLLRDSMEMMEGVEAIGCNVDCCNDKDLCNAANKQGLSFYMFTLLSFTSISSVAFFSSLT